MLRRLYIKNYALIDELEIEWPTGFITLTGETGAGKSILLGALGLVLGNRADGKALRKASEKCIAEAEFTIDQLELHDFFLANDLDYGTECIIRREIASSGKSRAFVNDTPVTLDVLRSLGDQLVDIHSQQETYLLADTKYQLSTLDGLAGNGELLKTYGHAWKDYQNQLVDLRKLEDQIRNPQGDLDYIGFLVEEFQSIDLDPDRYTTEREQLELLEHQGEILDQMALLDQLQAADEIGLGANLKKAKLAFQNLASLSNKYSQWLERFESIRLELDDLLHEVQRSSSEAEINPKEAELLRNRQDVIQGLLFKHRLESLDQLIEKRDQLKQSLENLLQADAALAKQKKLTDAAKQVAEKEASVLGTARRKAAKTLVDSLQEKLRKLHLQHAQIDVLLKPSALGPTGSDQIELLFSANPGSELLPLRKVASGGEKSRVMLALKAQMCEATALPTIFFDEIDTGVSGETAAKIGEMMAEMGKNMQVVAITHLPQIAALGSAQIKVQKQVNGQETTSSLTWLSSKEREEEVARLLSGSSTTSAAIEQARELLKGSA